MLALNNVDLSYFFWVDFLGMGMPKAPADASKPPGRFHLRNFLIYGRKLY